MCFYCGRKRLERHFCPADYNNDGCLLVDRIFKDEPVICPADFPISEETKNELQDGVMLLFPQPTLVDEFSSADGDVQVRGDNFQEQYIEDDGWTQVLVKWTRNNSRGRGSARRDGISYDNVVRGNRTWVSKEDLVFKWCPMADGDSDSGASGGKSGAVELVNDSGNKGKSVKKITDFEAGDEVFMETEDREFEQVQVGGNRKRIRSEAKGGAGPNYNLEDVD
ncbi:hypothetical protein ACFX11_019717 [Malus domestica]